MSHPDTPQGYNEARIFVRHSDGSSLVVPENTGDIERLSFSIDIPSVLEVKPGESVGSARFDKVKKVLKNEEETDLSFFALQQFFGSESAVQRQSDGRLKKKFAYAYIGQVWPGRKTGETTGRLALLPQEAHMAIKHSPAIDSIDRLLAFRVLQLASDRHIA